MKLPSSDEPLMHPAAGEALTSIDEASGGGSAVSSGAARYAAALDHKRAQASRLQAPADLAAVATAPSAGRGNMQSSQQASEPSNPGLSSVAPWEAAPAAEPAAILDDGTTVSAAAPGTHPAAGSAVAGGAAGGGQHSRAAAGSSDGDAAAAASQQQPASPRLRTLQAAPSNAPQRVRSAMAAALQYRASKASEAAAAASAAASAAALPPSVRRPRQTPPPRQAAPAVKSPPVDAGGPA